MKKETKVNCEVESCKHNEDRSCSLDELDISCICSGDDCYDKDETICDNFSRRDEEEDDCVELEYEEEIDEDDEEEDEEDDEYSLDDEIEEDDDYSEEDEYLEEEQEIYDKLDDEKIEEEL